MYRAKLQDIKPAKSDPEGFEFRALRATDFSHGALFQEKNRAAYFEQRLNAGHRCFGFVTQQGETVAYLWLSSPQYETPSAPFELGLSCRIPPRTGYIWDCRTKPEFRNRGLYRHGLKLLQALCRADGLQSAVIATEVLNGASKAAIMAAGFAADYKMVILRLLGRIYFIAVRGSVLLRGPHGTVDL